jgi:Hg(II)-responsive transcriptional regulator
MKIGEVAKRAGVNAQTLRYYERRGLLPVPTRSLANYREYGDEVVTRVRFIKRAQAVGFDLHEVRDLLRLNDGPHKNPDQVRDLAITKLEEIEAKLSELGRMRTELRRLVGACKRRKRKLSCPILEALASST